MQISDLGEPREMCTGVVVRAIQAHDDGTLAQVQMEPGGILPLHTHPHYEVISLTSGVAFAIDGDDASAEVGSRVWTRMEVGQSFRVEAGVPHTLSCGPTEGALLHVMFPQKPDRDILDSSPAPISAGEISSAK